MTSKERSEPILTEKEREDKLTREELEALRVSRMERESEGGKPLDEGGVELYIRDLDNGLHDMSRDQLLYYRHFLQEGLKIAESKEHKDKSVTIRINAYIIKINNRLNQNKPIETEGVENQEKKVEKYTLEIGELAVGDCIKNLKEALADTESGPNAVIQFKHALEKARTERQLLLERIIENPDARFQDNGNLVTDREKMESSISRIDQALKTIPTAETKKEEGVKEKTGAEKIEHRSIINEINAYFERYTKAIEKGDETEIEDLKTEISAFILEHGRDIQVKLNKLDEAKADKKSKLYKILDSDLNDLGELHSKINEGTQEQETTTYDSISGQISQYLEQLQNERTPEVDAEISEYILQNEGKIRSLIENIKQVDRKSDNEVYNTLTKDLIDLHNLKKELGKKGSNKENKNEIKYKRINIGDELSAESMAVLNTNQDLLSKILNAVNEYNNHLTDTDDEKAKYFKVVEDLRLEFLDYKRNFLKERSKIPKERKKGGKGDRDKKKILYGKYEDADEEHSINNEGEDNKKNKTESKTWRQEKNSEPTEPEDETPEDITTPNTAPKIATREEIFVLEAGKDYGEMIHDKKFDTWLNAVYKGMLSRGEAISMYAADIEFWYSNYQDAIPYIEKLNTIFDDIKRGNDKLKTLMSKDKIDDLLYYMSKYPLAIKGEIAAIYESYERTKEKEREIERYNKMEELKAVISNRTGNKNLTEADVKSVLEMNAENKEIDTANLKSFLQDIYNNYDFYNSDSKTETDPNNIYYTFRKWAAAKSGSVKPLGFWGRIKTRLFASFPQELKPEELNNFEALIKELRRLDLVDRKSGGVEKAMANKARLAEIIDFISNGIPPESDLDDEGKKKLKIFNDLYKVFTNLKYKSTEGKKTAQQTLDENTLDTSITSAATKPVPDLLFETDSEKKVFEDGARYQINRELLDELEGEIDNFPKARNPEKLKNIINRFTEIELVLKELGNDTDDKLALDKVTLKLHELILKNTKRDSYEELSASFATYDRIIKSETITKAKKIEYLNELIASLKTYQNNPANTMLQNATLNAIITKYQAELTSLN